jgi:hypothetical protein
MQGLEEYSIPSIYTSDTDTEETSLAETSFDIVSHHSTNTNNNNNNNININPNYTEEEDETPSPTLLFTPPHVRTHILNLDAVLNASTVPTPTAVNRLNVNHHNAHHPDENDSQVTNDISIGTGTSSSVGGNIALSGRAIGLSAGMAVGATLGRDRLQNYQSYLNYRLSRTSSNAGTTTTHSLSVKSLPSHRKIRRWNNDKFIGIASELKRAHVHTNPKKGLQIAHAYHEAEMSQGAYVLPNWPREYTSIFGTLATATTKGIESIPEVGLDEEEEDDDETTIHEGKEETKYDTEHLLSVRERFIAGEVTNTPSHHHQNHPFNQPLSKHESKIFENGSSMLKYKVPTRLLNVITRACYSSSFARDVMNAFESLVVHHLSPIPIHDIDAMNKTNVNNNTILNDVLIQPPLITHKPIPSSTFSSDSPIIKQTRSTIRLLFESESTKASFCRLIIHSVCQYHGLTSCSSTTSNNQRLMTIMGICHGSQFRMLDYVLMQDEDSTTSKNVGKGLGCRSSRLEDATTVVESMAGLEIRH